MGKGEHVDGYHKKSGNGFKHMSHGMRFPTMWYVRPVTAQSDQSFC